MSDLWLPPGARTFDEEVERAIEGSDDPALMRAAAEGLVEHGFKFPTEKFGDTVTPDSAVILFPERWSRIQTEKGETPLTAFVKSAELDRMIKDGNTHYELGSIVDYAENPVMNELCPAIVIRLKEFQIFVPLRFHKCPAPDDYLEQAQTQGLALAIDQGDNTYTYLSTGPLKPAGGLELPARSRAKAGRNEKCPCGSGIKFKKCCGA